MSKIGEPKVRFLSLSSLQTSRGGLLLAESALFTLPSLLFAAYEGGTPVRHCFFFSLYAFCHLADLRFSFFFLSFSHQARVLRPFRRRRPTLQLYILTLLLDASTVGTRAEDFSPTTGIPALRQQGNFAEDRAAVALVAATKKKRSASTQMSKIGEPKVRFLFFLFPHSKRVAAAFSLPRARCLPSSLCCLPRIRGHASSPLLFFFLSTRFATSLTFVFRSFPKLLASSASSPAQQSLSADVDPLSSYILALPLDASTVGTRAEDLSPSTGIPAAVLKQALYDSKGTSPRSTRPLPSSRRRRSAPHRHGCRKSENPRFVFFSFSFLTPNESRRPSPCRERVVYPPLFAVCRGFGGTPARHCFFSSLYAFCHLADLRFSFFFLSFSHQARVLRPRQSFSMHFNTSPAALQQHPRPAPRREHRRHSSKRSLSVDGDSGGGSQASTLRQQGNFAEEHAAVALVAAKKKRSASTRMSKIGEPKVRFLFFLFPHSKRVAAAFSLPRARCLPSPLCCLHRTRGALKCAIAFFFLSTR